MTPHDLLAAFETLADAPDGVKRLRDLVLSLAVRGELVRQDPREGRAAELLAQLQESKRASVASWGLRRSRPLAGIPADVPHEVPSAWTWCRMGDVANPQAGFAFRSTGFNEIGEGLPLIRIRDVLGGQTDTFFAGEYRDEFIVEKGDFLIGMDGNFNIGRWQGRRALLNQRVTRLRWFSGNVEPSFITIALQERLSELHGSKAYTTVQHLSGKQMEDALIPLPPLAEQHRIVARVDELMGLLDRLEADRNTRDELRRAARDAALADLRNAPDPEAVETAWTRIAQQMDDLFIEPEDVAPLRQAVLELAVLGRLTGDDVGSWSPTCLGDLLVDGPTNGWSPKAVDYPTPVKSLKLSATTRGYFDSEQYKYVDPSGGIDDRLWLKPGDLLIQRSNTPEYVGTAAVYDGPLRTFIYPDLMMRCRFAPTVDVAFIHVALSAPACRTWVSAKASGTSKSMVKINQSTVRSIPLSLPPKAKQIEIVESVRRLHELCDRLMVRLTSSRVLQAQFAGAAVHHLHI